MDTPQVPCAALAKLGKKCGFTGKHHGLDGKMYCGHHIKNLKKPSDTIKDTKEVDKHSFSKFTCFYRYAQGTYVRILYVICFLIAINFVHYQVKWYHYQHCESTLFRALTIKKTQLCLTVGNTLDLIESIAHEGTSSLRDLMPNAHSMIEISKNIKNILHA